MEFESNLAKVSHESSFKWKINNLNIVSSNPSSEEYFILKSPKVSFREANATWFLKAAKKISCTQEYLVFKLCLQHNSDPVDDNARYKFFVKGNQTTHETSYGLGWFNEQSREQCDETYVIGFDNNVCIPIDNKDEFVEIEAICELKTLNYEKLVEAGPEDDNVSEINDNVSEVNDNVSEESFFVHVEDSSSIDQYQCPEENIVSVSKKFLKTMEAIPAFNPNTTKVQSVETIADEKLSTDKSSSGSKTTETSSCMNLESEPLSINRRIEEICMVKMRQFAEMSADLFVTSVRINNAHLLEESSRSFAAQLTSKNFVEIWKIAKELNDRKLQDLVVDFTVKNCCPLKHPMPKDLLGEVDEVNFEELKSLL